MRRECRTPSTGVRSVLVGGEAEGPVLPADPRHGRARRLAFALEETFGPVASIEIVDDADAGGRAGERDGLRALGRDHHGRQPARVELAGRIESGIVHVNDQTVGDEPQMPFGGVKDSGWGRFGGRAAVEEFTELRWVTVQSGARHFPF